MWNIIIIFSILTVGIMIGAKDYIPKKIVKYNDKVTLIGVLSLLFVMGISIGMNKEVINDLNVIGWKGFLYAFFPVLFSIIFVYLFTSVLFRGKVK